MVGRYPAHNELKVVHGVMVLGMQCEGLDSEYTAMSSASYSNLWKLEVQKCGGFLELASACVLCLPSIMSRVFRMEATNWVSGMEEVHQNDSKYEYKGVRDGGAE